MQVTPLLTGAFGTSVVLGLKRKDGKQVCGFKLLVYAALSY
jgi:hypothetical protein